MGPADRRGGLNSPDLNVWRGHLLTTSQRRFYIPRMAALSAILEPGAGARHVSISHDDFVLEAVVRGARDPEPLRRRP